MTRKFESSYRSTKVETRRIILRKSNSSASSIQTLDMIDVERTVTMQDKPIIIEPQKSNWKEKKDSVHAVLSAV